MSEITNNRRGVKLPFGKYKDRFLSEVPLAYLLWAEENNVFPAQQSDIVDEIKRRSSGRPGAGKVVKRGK